jgi:transposase
LCDLLEADVKPYVQTNESDFLDAEAIAEAVRRPRIRFVPIKTEEHLDLEAQHCVRGLSLTGTGTKARAGHTR